MNRRRFLIRMGATTAGAGGVVGSGAFTRVNAQRDAEIDLENDPNAYLGLSDLGQGGRSTTENGLLTLQFPSDSEPSSVGLGADSVYKFSTDAETDSLGLFEVVNQGANTVEVYAEQITVNGVPEVSIYDVSDPTKLLDGNPHTITLSPGDSFNGGVWIDTHGVPIQNSPYDVTLHMHAEL